MSRFLKWSNVVCSALSALLAALAFPALVADPPACKLVQIAEWRVQLIRGLPVIDGSINGKKIGVLLDTAAFASLITNAAAESLELSTSGNLEFVLGVAGDAPRPPTPIRELRPGAWARKSLPT